MKAPLWVGALALLAAGCGARGAMGQATMFKECSPDDASCRRAAPAAPLAVGARLRPDVRVDIAGSVMPVVALASSRPDIVEISDGTMHARAAGMAAVLIATADGTVIDFQHVWVAPADRIVVERAAPIGAGSEEVTGPLELVAGESVLLGSTLMGGAQRLSGDSAVDWQLASCAGCPEVATLLRDGSTGRRRLVARAPGTAQITITGPGVATSLDVAVVP